LHSSQCRKGVGKRFGRLVAWQKIPPNRKWKLNQFMMEVNSDEMEVILQLPHFVLVKALTSISPIDYDYV
jgi:hypothetical protein